MRIIIISICVAALFAPMLVQAQGTIYLSNLGQASAGSFAIGTNSWVAAGFETGANASGYLLNDIQLLMTDASGNPSNFTAMLYRPAAGGSSQVALPGISLVTLNGSLNPVTAGIYTYTPASSFTLSPNYEYYIVLTAATAIANGAYEWGYAGANSYNPSGGWSSPGQDGNYWTSSNGHSWNSTANFSQFAIDATAIPEPSASWLLFLGSGVFYVCARHKRRIAQQEVG